MEYIGLQTQIWKNNLKSTYLLIAFPGLILFLTWCFFFIVYLDSGGYDEGRKVIPYNLINSDFIITVPWISGFVLIWFLVAYFSHSRMIQRATDSTPLQRKENMRVYNLVENLCISVGMQMPKINIINDESLNAFASGINNSSYTVTLSQGIIDKLNDKELAGVIAHELTHIRNRDVRLLIISIVFVGIFAFLSEMAFRILIRSGGSRDDKKDIRVMLLILFLASIGYLFSILFRFALSRKREYLADAGAVEMTKDSLSLASALEKISKDSRIEAVERKDVAQLFIENPQEKKNSFFSFLTNMFATHPPINERIRILREGI